jgi:hypothetical protein
MKPQTMIALLLLSLTTSPVAANLFVNSGFEDPITSDGPPFVGSWEGFNGGAGSSSVNSVLLPRTGLQSLELSIINVNNTFAGAFQDVPVLVAGTEYNFSGWHATSSNPLDVGVDFRIEWRNIGSNTEISRTPNSTSPFGPIGTYAPFSMTAAVPVGADLARVVYAIHSFGPEPSNTGTVYVDDVSFAVVPEPSTMALLSLGGLTLVALRRQRAWRIQAGQRL